jgi:hypothetical protein
LTKRQHLTNCKSAAQPNVAIQTEVADRDGAYDATDTNSF